MKIPLSNEENGRISTVWVMCGAPSSLIIWKEGGDWFSMGQGENGLNRATQVNPAPNTG